MTAVRTMVDTVKWRVTADDRTGAFEVAAALARGTITPVVSTFPDLTGDVVDLGSRAVDAAEAARRVAVAHSPDETETSVRRAHKIDSLLRGNWVVEIEALSRSTGLPVLHVAGSPAIGRTCVKGVVRADGDVVADLSNHPLYGARLSRRTELAAWSRDGWRHGARIALLDVARPTDVAEFGVVLRLESFDGVVVGPALPIGAVLAPWVRGHLPRECPLAVGPIGVVCGSASPIAARQLEQLRSECPQIEVIAVPPASDGAPLHPSFARDVAAAAAVRRPSWGATVIVGGETAAAVLGDAPRRVCGQVSLLSMPWSTDLDGGDLVVTKAGAFGGADSLVQAVRALGG